MNIDIGRFLVVTAAALSSAIALAQSGATWVVASAGRGTTL